VYEVFDFHGVKLFVSKIKNGKWLPEFLKASAWHQLYLPLLPFTNARSESISRVAASTRVLLE